LRLIEVVCPSCGETKRINIHEAIFAQKKFGPIKNRVGEFLSVI